MDFVPSSWYSILICVLFFLGLISIIIRIIYRRTVLSGIQKSGVALGGPISYRGSPISNNQAYGPNQGVVVGGPMNYQGMPISNNQAYGNSQGPIIRN